MWAESAHWRASSRLSSTGTTRPTYSSWMGKITLFSVSRLVGTLDMETEWSMLVYNMKYNCKSQFSTIRTFQTFDCVIKVRTEWYTNRTRRGQWVNGWGQNCHTLAQYYPSSSQAVARVQPSPGEIWRQQWSVRDDIRYKPRLQAEGGRYKTGARPYFQAGKPEEQRARPQYQVQWPVII